MPDVALGQQALGGRGVAGGEGVDEGGGFFDVGRGVFLLNVAAGLGVDVEQAF